MDDVEVMVLPGKDEGRVQYDTITIGESGLTPFPPLMLSLEMVDVTRSMLDALESTGEAGQALSEVLRGLPNIRVVEDAPTDRPL